MAGTKVDYDDGAFRNPKELASRVSGWYLRWKEEKFGEPSAVAGRRGWHAAQPAFDHATDADPAGLRLSSTDVDRCGRLSGTMKQLQARRCS